MSRLVVKIICTYTPGRVMQDLIVLAGSMETEDEVEWCCLTSCEAAALFPTSKLAEDWGVPSMGHHWRMRERKGSREEFVFVMGRMGGAEVRCFGCWMPWSLTVLNL
jgi:hypothetical protein